VKVGQYICCQLNYSLQDNWEDEEEEEKKDVEKQEPAKPVQQKKSKKIIEEKDVSVIQNIRLAEVMSRQVFEGVVVTMVAVHMMSCHSVLCYTVEWPGHCVYSTGRGIVVDVGQVSVAQLGHVWYE